MRGGSLKSRKSIWLKKTELTIFVTEAQCVFCETGIEVTDVIQTNIVLQRPNRLRTWFTACNCDISVYVYSHPQGHGRFTMMPKPIQSIVDRNLNSEFPRAEMRLFKRYKHSRNTG